MLILEWVSDWEAAERKWIARSREAGHNLLNVEEGGLGSWAKGGTKPARTSPQTFCDAMILAGKVIGKYQRDGKAELADELLRCVKVIQEKRDRAAALGADALAAFDAGFTKDKIYGRPPGYMASLGLSAAV